MPSVLFARNERHRVMGLLIKVRAVLYIAASLMVMTATAASLDLRLSVAIGCVAAAVAPALVRRGGRFSGVRLSAWIDVGVSYLIWLTVPAAVSITLLITIWAVAVVTFLSPLSVARRFALSVVAIELTKVVVVFSGINVAVAGEDGAVWLILLRLAAISGSFLVLRVMDRYLQTVHAAAESGSDRFKRLMDATPTAFLVVSGGTVVYANGTACDLLDGDTAELVGSSFEDMVEDESQSSIRATMRQAKERLEPLTMESVVLNTLSGDRRTVGVAVTAVDYDNDLAVQIALHDLSAQKEAESRLLETQTNYGEFVQRIPVALYRSRPNGEIIQVNRALVELFGAADQSEIVGKYAQSFYVHGADRDQLIESLDESGTVVGFEANMQRVDGSNFWVRDTSRLVEVAAGTVYEGAMTDITSRRSIEDELWARAVQQEAAASIGQIALEMEDIDEVMVSVAETVARVLRTDGAMIFVRSESGSFEIVGQSADLEIAPGSVAALADRARMTAAPVVLRTEVDVRQIAPKLAEAGVRSGIAVMIPGSEMDFGTLTVLSYSERVFASDDLNFLHSVSNVVAAAVDRASAKARLEELLRSKDEFVASVSHELRTPLTVVTGMAYELNERWRELSDDELAEFTDMLVEQSRDMSDLIEDLLVAARASIGNVTVRNEPVELHRQVQSVLASFASSSSSQVSAELLDAVVDADPIRVRQIVRNLLSNAKRYGGPNIQVLMSSTAGAWIVEVIDDGDGIHPDDRERVFEAYERAHHAVGQPGSVGLGLSVSRTLAELMGGSLTYRYDGRSVFRLELSRHVGDGLPSDDGAQVEYDVRQLALSVRRIGVVD